MPATSERILKDLEKHWAGLAGGAGPEGVLRACAMTLIVLADETDDRRAISETLAAVMRSHPHRAIVVQTQPGAALEYAVSSQCWIGSGRRSQVCCEQIDLTCAAERIEDLAPVLEAIRAPDLPVVIWRRSPRLAGLVYPGATKTIVDSYGVENPAAALAEGGERVADLAWTRITRWREIVAQVFSDPAHCALLAALDSVRVFHAEPRTASTAFYLAGWIEASLGREIAAAFETVPPVLGGIEGLVLEGGGHRVSMRRVDGPAVLIEVDTLKSCTMCPRLGETELLSNELSILGRDAVFEKTLPAARRLAAAR